MKQSNNLLLTVFSAEEFQLAKQAMVSSKAKLTRFTKIKQTVLGEMIFVYRLYSDCTTEVHEQICKAYGFLFSQHIQKQ